MTYDEFQSLVRRMRAAQVNYFKTRARYHLEESKALEKQVDEHLKEKKVDNQTKLF